ncbi:MAG TPA: tetratricopeptide repeat protein [Stellaceae bacterium]|nr:tetratricopeptide repeat protein [Stellaceae bacterium]
MRRLRLSRPAGAAVLALLVLGGAAYAQSDYAPENAARTVDALRMRCAISFLCPIGSDKYQLLEDAVGGDREAQYRLGLILDRGDGLPRDQRGATGWYGRAAELGHAKAALALNRARHDGAAIEADETKIVAALGVEIDKGNTDAMRALADMRIYGRGAPRDAEAALALLRRASTAGDSDAEIDLANLYLSGAPGVPKNRGKGFRWMEVAGTHGNIDAMHQVGYMYTHAPDNDGRDPAKGYRWLMRAALLNNYAAQEDLSVLLNDGAMIGAHTVIAPDPVAADMWLRLAARSQFHDNPSIRNSIESKMTSAQLDEAKKRAAEWHPRALAEVLAMQIDPPSVAAAQRPWPRGLMGAALDRFKEGGDNPEPWQRLPDFDSTDAVIAAITAIAEHCEQNGQKRCAESCRKWLDYVVPPLKPGGLSTVELAKYLQEHPNASPVVAMRKEPATPEEAMRSWELCAQGVADTP